jgi:hypothetical protein
MNQDAAQSYVERSRQLIETSPQMSEETTKVRLVQPFLELLGWDLYSTEVEPEYTVPMASGSTRVDYALMAGGSPVVFVEAKPVRSDLSDDQVQQLKSYMRQQLEVDWGIITNGKQFEVLSKGWGSNPGEEVSVARFDLNDLVNDPKVLEILSKDAIRSGRADEIAEQVARTNEVIRYLSENEEEVARTIVDAIKEQIIDFPINLEEQARNFTQNLISALREQRRFVSERADLPSETSAAEPDSTESSDGEATSSDELQAQVNKVTGTIARSDITGKPDAKMAVFPTRGTGEIFLRENEAWGYVRVGQDFEYVAMYVTEGVSEVRYFAEVDGFVDPYEADLERHPHGYGDRDSIADGKKIVTFKSGTLYELEDPIPYASKHPQSLRYTTLQRFRDAETTDDLF